MSEHGASATWQTSAFPSATWERGEASRATADVIAFNMARHDLEVALGDLGNYVNTVANGSPVTVEKSGFPSYETARPADPTAPAAPGDVRLRQGDLSGEIVIRRGGGVRDKGRLVTSGEQYRPDRERSMNEVQKCTGDPAVEANWQHAGMFGGGKATIGSLTQLRGPHCCAIAVYAMLDPIAAMLLWGIAGSNSFRSFNLPAG